MVQNLLIVVIGIIACVAAVIDGHTKILPNRLNLAIAILSIIWACYSQTVIPAEAFWVWFFVVVVHMVLVVVPPYGLGGGDLKLIAALGITASVESRVLTWLILSYAMASFAALVLRSGRKAKTLAFGPWLVIAWIAAFVGQ